ncbi:MAG: hypothetical protein HKM24_05985 [Gammaproteobacteria bacterium]|nr:hypothetical protein [Gammaproteobacteria bacterium]
MAEFSGELGFEGRHFIHNGTFGEQQEQNVSVYLEPEWFFDWDDGKQRFLFTPFLRWDEHDSERTHVDVRELYWQRSFDRWELSVGLRKFFWGVTESAHVVDIINQDDGLEDLDLEDKLGQPMVHTRWLSDAGDLDFFVMPYFRERDYAGAAGRVRPFVPVNTEAVLYESSDEENHVDWAVRWTQVLGDWDLGLAHFSGTARDPLLLPDVISGDFLIPYYYQIDVSSLDIQGAKGDTLWKLEVASGDRFDGRYTSLASGLEHTLVGVFDTPVDVGLIFEYLFDDRDLDRPIFDNDIAIGARLAFNDAQSSELLAFSAIDVNSRAQFISVEGSRRLGDNWTAALQMRFFSNIDDPENLDDLLDPLSSIRDDDYVELTLARHF